MSRKDTRNRHPLNPFSFLLKTLSLQVEQMIADVDKDGSGEIDFDEFPMGYQFDIKCISIGY
ncbi:hypothetical protein KY285_023644 [Solanum tuberosum]|nr:hypothetical protein KY289_023973 [Solanum tuberosum]KAH0675843.1 hypothetical protein KY285_023644 [Solanum tuberosum]